MFNKVVSYLNNWMIKKIIFLIFLSLILYFFWNTLIWNYSRISEYNFQFNYYYIVLSLIFYIGFVILLALYWRDILNTKNIKKWEVINIYLLAWLWRYIPWKIAHLITKIVFLEKKWIKRLKAVLSVVYELIFQMLSSMIIVILVFAYLISDNFWEFYLYWIMVFFIWILVLIHPKVFHILINLWLKILKKNTLHPKEFIKTKWIIKYIFLYSLATLAKWTSFILMVKWITNVSNEVYIHLLWAWIFAESIGMIVIFTPNWIWVREWVLSFLLKPYFSIEIAIIISLFSRLFYTIWDWIILIYTFLLKLWKKYQKN